MFSCAAGGSLLVGLWFGASCARNQAVRAYEAWADEACACKDAACRAAARAHGVKLAQDTQDVKGTLKDGRAVKAATDRAAKCLNVPAAPAAADAGVTP